MIAYFSSIPERNHVTVRINLVVDCSHEMIATHTWSILSAIPQHVRQHCRLTVGFQIDHDLNLWLFAIIG